MYRGWWIGLVVSAGCADLSGKWLGECTYEAGAKERKVDLVLTLEELSDKGAGEGTGKIIDGDTSIPADVLYVTNEDTVSIDLYPDEDDGKPLFFRGHKDSGSLLGACGDESPTTLNVGEALGCVAGVDPDCEDASTWQQGKRPAPVTSDDLSGRFTLDQQ